MMGFLRFHLFSFLIGSVVSLNHGIFIGTNDFDGTAHHLELPDDFFDFFTPLPPVPPPPTRKPTKHPTLAPVRGPTIPAGRFPTPIVTPTVRPSTPGKKPPPSAPVPAGHFPQPTHAHHPAPTNNSNQRPPPPTFVPHPVAGPHLQHPYESHPAPQQQHPQTPPPVQPKVATRIASYIAEWGSDVNHCQHVLPNVFFNCHEGGVIGIVGSENAKCTRVGNDRVQCTQEIVGTDSSIEFTCSGVRKVHLRATATIGPNVAADCERDGKVIKYLTLSRKCGDHIDTNPACNGGMQWKQGSTNYCASPALCTGKEKCGELKLDPLAMSNTNDDLQCSRADPSQNLEHHSFDISHLSSTTVVEWRISGQGRGCLWKSPPLLLRCENDGRLEFFEDYSFCTTIPKDNMAQCQSFAPYSVYNEESIDLFVKCTGLSEDQLILSVEVPTTNIDVECNLDGSIIQSVMLSRGCGDYKTNEFTTVNHPSFCDYKEQEYRADASRTHCFVGDTCLSDTGCSNMQLAHLTADTGSGPIAQCTNVV